MLAFDLNRSCGAASPLAAHDMLRPLGRSDSLFSADGEALSTGMALFKAEGRQIAYARSAFRLPAQHAFSSVFNMF